MTAETFLINTMDTRITTDVESAASLLRKGGLVAFPTETVYGLGADATNVEAVAKVFAAKQRPTFDPLIVHICDRSQLPDIVTAVSDIADLLMRRFWPGPLTLVLPRTAMIPDLVTAGLPGVGVRMPMHPIALKLLRSAGCPVAAPSANPFGRISPTTAAHVIEGLGNRVDCVVDGGPCLVGLESTVLSLMDDRPVLLRPGGCPPEDIEKEIGAVERAVTDLSKDDAAQPAPGMLSRHYAPRTPLTLIDPLARAVPLPGRRTGLMTWGASPEEAGFDRVIRLTESNDLTECAAKFFASLRTLDTSGLNAIIARRFPEHGLGIAMNDRLRRAATR